MTKQKAIKILNGLIPYLEETNNEICQIVTDEDIQALKYILKDYAKTQKLKNNYGKRRV